MVMKCCEKMRDSQFCVGPLAEILVYFGRQLREARDHFDRWSKWEHEEPAASWSENSKATLRQRIVKSRQRIERLESWINAIEEAASMGSGADNLRTR